MRRSSLIYGVSYGALLAALAHSAFADDLVVGNGTAITTPLETTKAKNGSPGNITTEQGSNVTISTPGGTVTLNSNNSIDHSGNIQNLAVSGGIGIHILGGFTGSFTSEGLASAIINVTGNGTGNYGLLLDGNASFPFTGNLTFQNGSTIIIHGVDSAGVAIKAPLTGNLTTGSAIQATGEGATGVLVSSDITGMFTHSGSIAASGTATFTSANVDPLSGSGIAIGGNITQGFLITGAIGGTDATAPGSVTNSSNKPAVIISPRLATGNVSDITIGNLIHDTAKMDYSFINRGSIRATENDAGISTIAVQIGELGNHSVTLTNGFYNRSLIVSSSESDNNFSTSVAAVPTNATGLVVGNATITPFLSAQTVGNASWSTKALAGSGNNTVVLNDHASDVSGVYNDLTVTYSGDTHRITGYTVTTTTTGNVTVTTKTATIEGNWTLVPPAGADLDISANLSTSVPLNASASDVSGVYNNLRVTMGADLRVIKDYVVIYDPTDTTKTPVLRVAKVGPTIPGDTGPWTSPPVLGGNVTITGGAVQNDGRITASMGGTKGGVVTAVLLQPGAQVPTLFNNGFIEATASTSDPSIANLSAYGINDLSGNLTTIYNTGNISGQTSAITGGIPKAVAVDLSHGNLTENIYVVGQGTMTGDVLFGGGSGNRLVIEGHVDSTVGNITTPNYATVSGSMSEAPGGTLDIYVSAYNTGGILSTAKSSATSLSVGDTGKVEFALTKTSAAAPLIATTGNVNFHGSSLFELNPTTFLPQNGNYTLISTGSPTGLHFDNFKAPSVPFLVDATFSTDKGTLTSNAGNVTAQALYVNLQRKTATTLGLQGPSAAIFEPFAAAALADDQFGAALLKLSNAEEVKAAVASTVPDIAGGVRALTVAMTDQATGVIGSRQRALLTAPAGSRTDFHFWSQEFYNSVADSGTAVQPGFGGAGQGVAIGAEWGSLQTGRYGVGYTFFSSQETERHPRDTKTNGDWNLVSAYAAWKFGDFFVAPQINGGMGDFKSRRSIVVGNILGRTSVARWSSYLGAGGVTTGYIIAAGNFQIIPTIAIDGMYLNEGAYNEFGGSGMSVTLKSQSQTSVRTFAGVIGQGTYMFNEGAFVPQLLAGWSHEFVNDPVTIDGSFESSPGSPFHLVGPTLDANKIVGGMSFGYVLRNWSAGFNYDASASSGALAHSATISLSSRF